MEAATAIAHSRSVRTVFCYYDWPTYIFDICKAGDLYNDDDDGLEGWFLALFILLIVQFLWIFLIVAWLLKGSSAVEEEEEDDVIPITQPIQVRRAPERAPSPTPIEEVVVVPAPVAAKEVIVEEEITVIPAAAPAILAAPIVAAAVIDSASSSSESIEVVEQTVVKSAPVIQERVITPEPIIEEMKELSLSEDHDSGPAILAAVAVTAATTGVAAAIIADSSSSSEKVVEEKAVMIEETVVEEQTIIAPVVIEKSASSYSLEKVSEQVEIVEEVVVAPVAVKEPSSSSSSSEKEVVQEQVIVQQTIVEEQVVVAPVVIKEPSSSSSSSSETEVVQEEVIVEKTIVEEQVLVAPVVIKEPSSSSSSEKELVQEEVIVEQTIVEEQVVAAQLVIKERSSSSSSSSEKEVVQEQVIVEQTVVEEQLLVAPAVIKEPSSSSSSSSEKEVIQEQVIVEQTIVEEQVVVAPVVIKEPSSSSSSEKEVIQEEVTVEQTIVEEQVVVVPAAGPSSPSSSSSSSEEVIIQEAMVVAQSTAIVEETIVQQEQASEIKQEQIIIEETVVEEQSAAAAVIEQEIVQETVVVEEKIKMRSMHEIRFANGWGTYATLASLWEAGCISEQDKDDLIYYRLEETNQYLLLRLQKWLFGVSPIAGLRVYEAGQTIEEGYNMTILEAKRRGILGPGTAVSLLEAQAATGAIIDPQTAFRYTVAESMKANLIEKNSQAIYKRSENAVHGYINRKNAASMGRTRRRGDSKKMNLFEAMRSGMVVEQHGMRCLEAQIATGGIINVNRGHRVPLDFAYSEGIFDAETYQMLVDPSDDTLGFTNPTTGSNQSYDQMLSDCMWDDILSLKLIPYMLRPKSPERSLTEPLIERTVELIKPEEMMAAYGAEGGSHGKSSRANREVTVSQATMKLDKEGNMVQVQDFEFQRAASDMTEAIISEKTRHRIASATGTDASLASASGRLSRENSGLASVGDGTLLGERTRSHLSTGGVRRRHHKVRNKVRKKTVMITNPKTGEELTIDGALQAGLINEQAASKLKQQVMDYNSPGASRSGSASESGRASKRMSREGSTLGQSLGAIKEK